MYSVTLSPNNLLKFQKHLGISRKSATDGIAQARSAIQGRVLEESIKVLSGCPKIIDERGIIGNEGEIWYLHLNGQYYLEPQKNSPLDILNENRSVLKKEKSWGKFKKFNKFGSKARNRLLSIGGTVDKVYKEHKGYLITLTIPGSGWSVCETVSKWSGWLVEFLTKEVRNWNRHHEKRDYFYVWELQNRGALHMHWWISPGEAKLAYKIVEKWYELLGKLSDEQKIDLFRNKKGGSWRKNKKVWQWNVQQVKKSVGAYFAKYASKSANSAVKTDNSYRLQRIGFFKSLAPGRWYAVSKGLREKCKELTVTYEIDIINRDDLKRLRKKLLNLAKDFKQVGKREINYVIGDEKLGVIASGQRTTIIFKEEDYFRVKKRLEKCIDAIRKEYGGENLEKKLEEFSFCES